MFEDEVLEKIFADPETQVVPIGYQSIMIQVIGKAIEEVEGKTNAASIHES